MEFLKAKTTISEVKNILSGINEKLDIVDEKISESEDIAVEIIQMKQRKGLETQENIFELRENLQFM